MPVNLEEILRDGRHRHRANVSSRSAELKYAGELRVSDVWTERTEGGDTRGYRVIAIARDLVPITIRVTGSCVITGSGA
jgi:hypothetical protein